MKKIYPFLAIALVLILAGSLLAFKANNEYPKEKQARFIDKKDVAANTITILEKNYQGDLENLPEGTIRKTDVRVNAKTGETLKRRILVIPK